MPGLVCIKKIDWLKPLTLKSGEDKFSVRLSSNPTTGYMWVLRHWPKWIQPKGHKYTENKHKPGMVGVGGRDVWFFKTKYPATKVPLMGLICWRYTRAWTGAGQDTCQYIVSTPDD